MTGSMPVRITRRGQMKDIIRNVMIVIICAAGMCLDSMRTMGQIALAAGVVVAAILIAIWVSPGDLR